MSEHNKQGFDFKAVFEVGDYLYFYEEGLTRERTEKEVGFLVKELELRRGMKILDVACGHGRHANLLAELGYDVTGIDITKGFLKIAEREAKKKGVTVQYLEMDMRKMRFRSRFDRVLLLFTSFGYFNDDGNFLVLKNIARALKPGGLFCFDTFNRDALLKRFLPYLVMEKGKDLMADINRFDAETGRLYCRRIVFRNGRRKVKPFFVRLYNLTEMRDLLNRVGLKIYKLFSDFDSNPLTNESGRMIIVAKKQ